MRRRRRTGEGLFSRLLRNVTAGKAGNGRPLGVHCTSQTKEVLGVNLRAAVLNVQLVGQDIGPKVAEAQGFFDPLSGVTIALSVSPTVGIS